MKKTSFKQIDLLRKRRIETYLLEPAFVDNKKFIKKGIYIGLTIISFSIISGIFFMIRASFFENKKIQIQNFSDQHDSLQFKLDKDSAQLKVIAGFNKKLKSSIININSSSALLREISLRIPQEMQLTNLNTQGNSLSLQSKIDHEKSLELINGFLLSLDKSDFIEFNDIDLTDVTLKEENGKSFFLSNIKTKINSDFEKINQKYLIDLGSLGLAKRINLLKKIERGL